MAFYIRETQPDGNGVKVFFHLTVPPDPIARGGVTLREAVVEDSGERNSSTITGLPRPEQDKFTSGELIERVAIVPISAGMTESALKARCVIYEGWLQADEIEQIRSKYAYFKGDSST